MTRYRLDGQSAVGPERGDYWVAPGARVMGDVVLEEATGIWFGAVLRGDTEQLRVGAGTNIQENCVLHADPGFPMTVERNCTVGHKAMLHGCTIGDNSLIGMGATILNNAVIGKNCLIGAGALVTEGKVIPDNSMVLGSPGKVVKELGPEWEQRLAASALSYQNNMRRFRDGLKPL